MNARNEAFAPGLDREVAHLRVPPHSIEAESSVLGGLMLDNGAWDRVGDLLTDEDFYRYEHKLIFAAIAQLINASRPADVITVFERLQSIGKAGEVGGLVYLNALAQYIPGAGAIRSYAETVRERAILRKLVSVSDEIATAAFNPQGRTVAQILDSSEAAIMQIGEAKVAADDEWVSVGDGLTAFLDRIQAEADGTQKPDIIPFGLDQLDERLDGGGRPGELIVVGARPSMGKSALGLTMAVNVAQDAQPVGYFSMEMPTAQVMNRAMSMVSAIHLSRLKRAERLRDFDWPNITKGVEKLRKLPLYISDMAGLNINHIRTRARRLKRTRGLRMLVIDYLGLMDGLDPKQSRTYQLEDITKGLKRLAKELGIVVVLLVQLSRKVEERVDQMPILSDLRDSGAIEQDADIVIFVHRPFKSTPTLGDEWKYYAKLSVSKVRDGEPGYLDLMYVGENTHFMNWPADQEIPTNKVRIARTGKTEKPL